MIFDEKYAHNRCSNVRGAHETPKLCRLFIPDSCAPAENPVSSYSINGVMRTVWGYRYNQKSRGARKVMISFPSFLFHSNFRRYWRTLDPLTLYFVQTDFMLTFFRTLFTMVDGVVQIMANQPKSSTWINIKISGHSLQQQADFRIFSLRGRRFSPIFAGMSKR